MKELKKKVRKEGQTVRAKEEGSLKMNKRGGREGMRPTIKPTSFYSLN